MKDDEYEEKILSPEEQVAAIQEACSQLEWSIAMKDTEDGVKGLVIGNIEFVQKTVEQLEDSDEYCVWGRPDVDNSEMH